MTLLLAATLLAALLHQPATLRLPSTHRVRPTAIMLAENETKTPLPDAIRSGVVQTLRFQLPILFVTDFMIAPLAGAIGRQNCLRALALLDLASMPLGPISVVLPAAVAFVSCAVALVLLLPFQLAGLVGSPAAIFKRLAGSPRAALVSVLWIGPLSEEILDRALLQRSLQRRVVDRFGRDRPRRRKQLWAGVRLACALHFGCSHAHGYTALVRNQVPQIPAPRNVLSQCGMATLASWFIYCPAYRQHGFAAALAAHCTWNAFSQFYARLQLLVMLVSPPLLLGLLSSERAARLEGEGDADTVVRWAGRQR